MKEFEKWLRKSYGKLMDGTSFEANTKEGFRAALEWLEAAATAIDRDADGFDIGDLHKIITKELET